MSTDYASAVYEFLVDHVEMIDGRKVSRAAIHPWLVREFGLERWTAKRIRTDATRELARQQKIKRPNPRSRYVEILD
jgi:hypothetical protein